MKFIFFFIFLILISCVSAQDWVVEIGENITTEDGGWVVDMEIPEAISNITYIPSNTSDWWDNLDLPNSTQMELSGIELNIKESWLTTFGNGVWCVLTGCTMTGDLTVPNINVTSQLHYDEARDTSLVGWWQFNNNQSLDSSIYGNDGTIVGADCTKDVCEFDGAGDYIDLASTITINGSTGGAISFWVKQNEESIDSILGGTTGNRDYIRYDSPANYVRVEFSSTGTNYYLTYNGITETNWNYGLINFKDYNGTDYNISLYMNGVFQDSETYVADGLNIYRIGKAYGDLDFNGTIDEVKIYNRALTENEIQQEYEEGNKRYGYFNELKVEGNLFVSGNVGIGTSSPTELLDVAGEFFVNELGEVGIQRAPVAGYGLVTNENVYFGGNVDIKGTLYKDDEILIQGTNSDLRFLADGGADYEYIQLGEDNADTDAKLRITRMGTANINIAHLEVYADDTYFSGNVGIGTSSPSHKLNVNGSANITDDLIVGGNLTLGDKITFALGEIIDNLVDGWLTITGNLNVTGNVTAENVFIPQYIFSHTNETIALKGASVWENVTISQEDSDLKQGITHTYNDDTNHTFTIGEDGVYDIDYDFDVEDTSVSASDIDVTGRMIYTNGSEIKGSVFESDITKQGVEVEISHDFLAELLAGDVVIFQFIATDVDVQISTHGTFGDYPESASIRIFKIANLP